MGQSQISYQCQIPNIAYKWIKFLTSNLKSSHPQISYVWLKF